MQYIRSQSEYNKEVKYINIIVVKQVIDKSLSKDPNNPYMVAERGFE